MNQYLELALWADLNLKRGEKGRIICPWCNGGSTREKSLSVACNEDGSLWWRCFRANCGQMGSRNSHGLRNLKAKKSTPRPFDGATAALSNDDYRYFGENFGLGPEDLAGVRYAYESNRYCFRVLSPSSKVRGVILRSFAGAVPKVLTFRERVDDPFMGWIWEGGPPRGPIVVVEDVLSALKVHKAGAAAVFLNGTYLNYQMVTEIADTWYEGEVIFALDKGTMPQMLGYKAKFDPLIGPIRIWKLEKDLKYERIESIREGLFGGKADFGEAPTSSSN